MAQKNLTQKNLAQIERIKQMEKILDESNVAVEELSNALKKYEAVQKKYYALSSYYGSVRWIKDYEDDESGKIPKNLKRAVLSEDAVYDLIQNHRSLITRMSKCVVAHLENE
ncbi:MAG: DUF4298 domain-containing protein [Treponema sp.]|nr:DUF4298 domain-containing protein [Treponema sp.]